MMRERVTTAAKVSINYAVGPDSGPPLLLLHGVTARWQSFMTLIPFLTPYWQVYALDFRGHGLSDRTSGCYSVADYTADLRAFLESQVSSPTFVLGHSLGGRVALDLAMTAPDLVRAIVVGDTPLTALSARGGEDNGFVKTFGIWHTLVQEKLPLLRLAQALGEVPARPRADGSPQQFKDFWDQGELLYTARCLQLVDPCVLLQISQGHTTRGFDILDQLERIGCPVLFLQGTPSLGALLTDADLEIALERVAQSTAITIAGTGHGMHRDQPLAVAQAVHNFLSSLQDFR
jgi:pimeloyl-ACP methyl ester carboxylesterase